MLVLMMVTCMMLFALPTKAKHITGATYQRQLVYIISSKQLNENEKLNKIMEKFFLYNLAQYPSNATYLGYSDYDDHWEDVSKVARDARQKSTLSTVEQLSKLTVKKLSSENQLNLQLLQLQLQQDIAGHSFPDEFMPINQMGGIQRNIPSSLNVMPTSRYSDYQNIISRLKDMPRLIEQTRELLKEGVTEGVIPPRITLRDIPRQIRALIPKDTWTSPLLKPFSKFPDVIEQHQQQLLRAQAAKIYRTDVIPAWEKLLLYFEAEYMPKAREEIALSTLKNGAEWYQWRVKTYTTTELTPEQIHQLGLDEVKRIRAEMAEIIKEVEYEGDFQQFLEFLRTDPQFFYTDEEELMKEYRNISKKVDGELPTLFKVLPRLPYGVKEIPVNEAKSQTTAYYSGGSIRAGRSGTFYANTYALNTRPKWEMIALTLHEAVPGHHLQIALAQELEQLPDFRKNSGFTVFVEGWALYAEQLGYPMGLYKTPYDRFGQLTYEMWRAIRLVVDTGMHAKGWSRQQAIDFFKANSSKSLHDIEVEIDRYIVWPGQALAYKIGQLTISRLRKQAEEQLGNNFDVREFHQRILENGAVPMKTLEDKINQWLSGQAVKDRSK